MIITINHVKQSMMCTKGARAFCSRHGLDWGNFLKNGIDEIKLIELDDAMAVKVVREAHNGKQ